MCTPVAMLSYVPVSGIGLSICGAPYYVLGLKSEYNGYSDTNNPHRVSYMIEEALLPIRSAT